MVFICFVFFLNFFLFPVVQNLIICKEKLLNKKAICHGIMIAKKDFLMGIMRIKNFSTEEQVW